MKDQFGRTSFSIPVLVFMILAMTFVMLTTRCARAGAPDITCDHVRQAAKLAGSNNPAHIARTLGLKLTDAQLAEAAKCLRTSR